MFIWIFTFRCAEILSLSIGRDAIDAILSQNLKLLKPFKLNISKSLLTCYSLLHGVDSMLVYVEDGYFDIYVHIVI